jgi:hypothetical protein
MTGGQMTKKEFLEKCEIATKGNHPIVVFVEIPGNKHLEMIFNHEEDVESKTRYYDAMYDGNMKHNHGPVKIKDIKVLESMDFRIAENSEVIKIVNS